MWNHSNYKEQERENMVGVKRYITKEKIRTQWMDGVKRYITKEKMASAWYLRKGKAYFYNSFVGCL